MYISEKKVSLILIKIPVAAALIYMFYSLPTSHKFIVLILACFIFILVSSAIDIEKILLETLEDDYRSNNDDKK